jgi:hypothetical protein
LKSDVKLVSGIDSGFCSENLERKRFAGVLQMAKASFRETLKPVRQCRFGLAARSSTSSSVCELDAGELGSLGRVTILCFEIARREATSFDGV